MRKWKASSLTALSLEIECVGNINCIIMRAHLHKDDFKFVAVSVMVLEVASFLIFIFGTLGAILGTYSGISTTDFILLGFGGIFIALMLMALAEMLQLVMRIEHNTRKENTLIMKQTQVQKEEVKATKKLVSMMKKAPALKTAKKVVRKKAAVKKPTVRKVKPRKKK